MSSSVINQSSPVTPGNDENTNKPSSTLHNSQSHILHTNTPPNTGEALRRQSSSGASFTPVTTITQYLKYMLGLNAKTTKRSLSEEAECGSPESLSEWLRQGSDPNEIDAYGYTPLINASLRGCARSAKILINHGADINMQAMHGYCALHAAAQNGHLELVETLLDNGADMEIKNDDGDTALMLAVRSDHAGVVDALCKRGCNMHTHGFDNVDPIEYAMNKHNLFLSDVLMKHERQHLNSASSSIIEPTHAQNSRQLLTNTSKTQSDIINSNNGTMSNEPLKSIPSLTTLLHQQQDEHERNQLDKKDQEPTKNDSVFHSDD